MPKFDLSNSGTPDSMTPVSLSIINYEIKNDSRSCLVEAKTIWLECENKYIKMGFGLSADTGIAANSELEITLLGFGIKIGNEFGVKLPFFSLFWRLNIDE
ncbi:hypothetical protein CAEBREN_12579 [Caenorhabditis brenneri]|uniref:Uncharacterized protein n=1 Tax=Caenorhabditis brenneri TaxID=135651 RepID=G0PKR4_CAEBE|nr:hypothetical protein CAEBREN_12579 [Caenorhabditis brenneri]